MCPVCGLLQQPATGYFLGVNRPGRGVDRPPPPNAEVNERVELYLYSISGPSRTVTGRTLPFFYLGHATTSPSTLCGLVMTMS